MKSVIKGVVDTNKHRSLGEYNNDWAYADDPKEWKKFTGTIELSND